MFSRVDFLKNPILQKLRFNTLGDWYIRIKMISYFTEVNINYY